MEFLTLLIVLGLLQWWGSGGPLHRDDWYYRWQEVVSDKIHSSPMVLLAVAVVPGVLVVVLQALFDTLLFGVFSLALYVLILLFSLGRGDFSAKLQEYLSFWDDGNLESAYEKANGIGDFHPSDAIEDPVSLHDHVRKTIMYEGYERWFAVVFWFMLLGPAACLVYRLCQLAARDDSARSQDQQLAIQVVYYLDWLPARLLVFSFTLTGNFVHCINRCWQIAFDELPIAQLLDSCGVAAISGFHESNARPTETERFIEYARAELLALQSLLSRSVVCWLMVIAVLQFF
ncbi:MAG: regulatory signaling modulator protein AmpE [Spongiibacteraceae bacterium]|nr:regulatory signaling modulator protein AmpE [Spongiibacteraceae bacterium]